ncbi:glycosyltransferase family 4 protein [Paenibacillus agricola]|uniref:Glycosyltransferase family 4 protein n=1 Tax=Paenibacillus agricola TaxID=2716264 RepID=A0ABX0IZJ5_9BACL|nr:glycosyltransferase family 4 protein [Paenibacillus agricola]NHN29407.1 glycosyltransferase family 4 protein [Paenibacillus agricola]
MALKKVLIIAPFTVLPGEKGFNRFRYIAEELARLGHEVELVTSNYSHAEKSFRQHENGRWIGPSLPYRLTLIEERGYSRNVSLERIRSHRCFERNLRLYLERKEQTEHVVYAAYPLMGAARMAGSYAKRLGIPFILDIQDIWPESINSVLKLPEPWLKLLVSPFTTYANQVYKLADYIVGVSDTYVARGKTANQNAKAYHCLFIGADQAYFDACACREIAVEKPLGQFWVTYIGTLSHSYDIETVIKAVSLLERTGYENVVLNIFGSGPHEARFKELAEQLQAPVRFMGHHSYEDMVPYLVRSDVAANAIAKGALASVTNKIGDFLFAGLPMINSCENKEVMDLVANSNIGFNYKPGDFTNCAHYIALLFHQRQTGRQLGANSRKLAESRFDRRKTYPELYRMIENM